jgi:hypothetical protein
LAVSVTSLLSCVVAAAFSSAGSSDFPTPSSFVLATLLALSVAGPICDLQLFSRSWGVDLGAIRAPAHLWIGTADTAVPISAARLLARSIAACAVTELPADGHFWVAANYRDVLEWIAERAGALDETRRSLQGAKSLKVHASPAAPSNASRATGVRPARYARKVRTRP